MKDKILEYLRTEGALNPVSAHDEFGITDLAGHIEDLKLEGYQIQTKIVSFGDRKMAEFSLEEYCLSCGWVEDKLEYGLCNKCLNKGA